jgi:hypothetical protein
MASINPGVNGDGIPFTFPPKTKIFGREPAVILGIIAAGLNLASAYVLHWDDSKMAAVNAVIAIGLGFAIAVFTKDSLLAVGLGFAQAIFAVSASFGFNISGDRQSAIMAVLNVVLALFNRQATEPDPHPSLTPEHKRHTNDTHS